MKEVTARDPDYQARVRTSFEKQEAMKTVGAQLVKMSPGEVVIEFPFDHSLTQQNGYIHAGIITTVVDSACGYAAYTLMPADSDVLSIEFKVNFMSPAKGETFRAIGRVMKSGRTITVCSGDVVAIENGRETFVAAMQATMICLVNN